MKETVLRKKEAHKEKCQNSSEKNKRRYKSKKNKANETATKAMREKAEETTTE